MTSSFPNLSIELKRIGSIVRIEGTPVSVTFDPKNKEKTLRSILEKCKQLLGEDYTLDTESNRAARLEIEEQLTQIYQEDAAQKDKVKSTKDEDVEEKQEFYCQKHTNGSLAEAVIVNGLPFFLKIVDGIPELHEELDQPSMILKPIELPGYLNKPYEFTSLDEIKEYINRSSNESIDTLYSKTKTIWKKYIDADNDHITICAADTIFTYFQDKLGLTHYLGFIGDNNVGKTNNLRVFSHLGYRAYLDTSITPANLYQFMGSMEEGQGIILEDEADNIDTSPEKMKIYKVGYTKGTPVSRIDTSYGRKQLRFWTYCFKAFSAERSPDPVLGKGFNERTFYLQCNPGQPEFDILEIINHADEPKYKTLYEDLIDTRKLLLVYRMLHFNEIIPQVRLSIKAREKQLTESVIRIFRNTQALPEILQSLYKFIVEKRTRKGNSLEAKLFKITMRLALENQYRVTNAAIWDAVKEELPGNDVDKRPQSYESEEFGLISKRQITGILKDRFSAIQKRDDERAFIFGADKLQKLARIYDISDKIEILPEDASEPTLKTVPTLLDSTHPTVQAENSPELNTNYAQSEHGGNGKQGSDHAVEVSKASNVSAHSTSDNAFSLMHKQDKGLWHCTLFPGLKTIHLDVLIGQCHLKDPDLKKHKEMMEKHSK